ncbi:MAG: type II toxin-antitoxin system RelE/ParE family toxin [Deltaproteobacteria bacterium]|nr:type II toxin-antitoxin system RelE/ParE family toxin [Deltaproteobacteria bacterium]
MAWKIEFSPSADKALTKLGIDTQKQLVRFLRERAANLENPRSTGKALAGPRLSGLWRYRVGDYRILCRIEDEKICIVVVEIGNRREIYKKQ